MALKMSHIGIVLSVFSTLISAAILIEGILFLEQSKTNLKQYPETDGWRTLLSNCALSVGVSMMIIFPSLAGSFMLKNRDLLVSAISFGSIASVILVVCGSLLLAYKDQVTWCALMVPELSFQSEAATSRMHDIICNEVPAKALSAGILSFLLFGILISVLGIACATEREWIPRTETATTTTIINAGQPQVQSQPMVVYMTQPGQPVQAMPGQQVVMMMQPNGQTVPVIMASQPGQPMAMAPQPMYTTDANGNTVIVG